MGFFRSLFGQRKRKGAAPDSQRASATPTPEEVMRTTGMSEDELTRRFMEHLIQSGKNPFEGMPDDMRRQAEEQHPDLADLVRKKFGAKR